MKPPDLIQAVQETPSPMPRISLSLLSYTALQCISVMPSSQSPTAGLSLQVLATLRSGL